MLTETAVMQYTTINVTEPVNEILTVAEVANYLRVDDSSDPLIPILIKASREFIETASGRLIHQRQVVQKQTGGIEVIPFMRSPVTNVISVQYAEDFDSTYETLETDEYKFNADNLFNIDRFFKKGRDSDGYIITYTAGLTADTTPSQASSSIKTAMLKLIAYMYENREQYSTGFNESGLSMGYVLENTEINRLINSISSPRSFF